MTDLFQSSDGDLVDVDNGYRVIRAKHQCHFGEIETGLQLRATLRAGQFAWPGGYQLALILSDGEALCFNCGHDEFKALARALRDNDTWSGWRVVGCEINWEDEFMLCAHCNKRIPSAYGNDDETNED